MAQDTLRKNLIKKMNTNEAKNVILFLGDGMSIPTITASRIYKGQLNGKSGEDDFLSFEEFPFLGLAKVIIIYRDCLFVCLLSVVVVVIES